MSSQVFGDDLHKLYPVIEHGMSDSGCFDNVVEFLCYAGLRQLPEVSHSQLRYHPFHTSGLVVVVMVNL